MNRLIIANGNDTYGNTALDPQIDTSQHKKNRSNRYKKLNEQKKEYLKKLQYKRLKKKIKVIKNVIIVFAAAIILVFRYAYICNLRKNVVNTQMQISKISKENNELTVELLKYNNLAYIEKVATEKLNMVKSNYKNSIYCDLNKNYISLSKSEEDDDEKKNEIIKILISKLF